MATEASRSAKATTPRLTVDQRTLDRAYCRCASLTALHCWSFYLASGLLPTDKRRVMRALYAFCRVSDNIVDHPQEDAKNRLQTWRI